MSSGTSVVRLETLTPLDIDSYTEESILALASELSDPCKIPIKSRCNLLKSIFKAVGYDLSPDLLLALLVETKHQLILAPAGGCKTTSSQIKAIFSKIIWKLETGKLLTASECLCLVYNRENEPQMRNKHGEILGVLLASRFISNDPSDVNNPSAIFVNTGINASTMHAFSNSWIFEYADFLKIKNFKLIKPEQETQIFNAALSKLKKAYPHITFEIKADKLKLAYDVVHGLLMDYDSLDLDNPCLYEIVHSTGISAEHLRHVFEDYNKTKKFLQLIDFTDQLIFMDYLLATHPDLQQQFYTIYPFIVVDEIQDFTPLMMSILQKIVGPDTKLLCIGDEDQSIYSFRGADIDNALKFTEKFPLAKVFQLNVNRRCGTNILDKARKIIELNKNRFKKNLLASRGGGEVDFLPYTGYHDMLEKLKIKISQLSRDDLSSTVICARDKIYGQPLTKALFDINVPYHTFNSARFEEHEFIRNFIEVMNLLWSPGRNNWKSMFKLVNINKTDWYSYLGCDPLKPNAPITKFPDVEVWWKLDFQPFKHYRKLRESLNFLYTVSRDMETAPFSKNIENILALFIDNYWISRCQDDIIPYSDDAVVWVKEFFNKPYPYPLLYKEYSGKTKSLYYNYQNKSGAVVATFHSLKGLEYKNVFMTYMDDSIFPSYSYIDSKLYSESTILRLKEAENRLAYVAMTRARDYLGIFYDTGNPSFYISELSDNSPTKFSENKIVFSRERRL